VETKQVFANFAKVSARALTCPEGGKLTPSDIMIEVRDSGEFDKNCKDLNIRVLAHDYPSREQNLDIIRRTIADEVKIFRNENRYPEKDISWYVWVILTKAGSLTRTGFFNFFYSFPKSANNSSSVSCRTSPVARVTTSN
jgi:hypothetical protein